MFNIKYKKVKSNVKCNKTFRFYIKVLSLKGLFIKHHKVGLITNIVKSLV